MDEDLKKRFKVVNRLISIVIQLLLGFFQAIIYLFLLAGATASIILLVKLYPAQALTLYNLLSPVFKLLFELINFTLSFLIGFVVSYGVCYLGIKIYYRLKKQSEYNKELSKERLKAFINEELNKRKKR